MYIASRQIQEHARTQSRWTYKHGSLGTTLCMSQQDSDPTMPSPKGSLVVPTKVEPLGATDSAFQPQSLLKSRLF